MWKPKDVYGILTFLVAILFAGYIAYLPMIHSSANLGSCVFGSVVVLFLGWMFGFMIVSND